MELSLSHTRYEDNKINRFTDFTHITCLIDKVEYLIASSIVDTDSSSGPELQHPRVTLGSGHSPLSCSGLLCQANSGDADQGVYEYDVLYTQR